VKTPCAALALGIDPALPPLDGLKVWNDKRRHLKPRPPIVMSDASFLENTASGQDVDLNAFPVPTGAVAMVVLYRLGEPGGSGCPRLRHGRFSRNDSTG
jgi:hypothetical protein